MVVNSERYRQRFAQVLSSGWRGCLLAVLMGLLTGILVVSPRSKLPILGLTAGVAGLFFWLYQPVRIPVYRVDKICCYLAFITGFFGVAFFSIDLGPFMLFPYRIFLVLLWGLFTARILIQGKLVLPFGRVRFYMVFFGIWTIYAVISLGWAAAKADAIRQVIFLFLGVSVIFFAIYYFRDDQALSNLYWIWYSVFYGLVLMGFWEHFTGQHLPISGYYGETRDRFMFRPTGGFRNPNDYATFLALSLPFSLSVLRYGSRWLARLIGLCSAFTAFYLIVANGSRASILAVLLEVTFLLLFLTKLEQRIKVAFATAFFMSIALLILPGPVKKFSSKVFAELSSVVAQVKLGYGSVAIRANLAKNGLEFLYHTAGFGVGAGNAEYWMANFPRYDTAGILNPHNWWLEVLINYGIFIFFGYVVVYIGVIRKLWRSWLKTADRMERMVSEALLVALIGFSVASISSSSIMAFNPNWMLFAFALAFLNHRRKALEEKTA